MDMESTEPSKPLPADDSAPEAVQPIEASPVLAPAVVLAPESEPAKIPTPIVEQVPPMDVPIEPVATDPVATVPISVAPTPIIDTQTDLSTPPVSENWDLHSKEELNYIKTVLGPKAWASHRARTQAKLDKIMELVRKNTAIDRMDVRLLLNVAAPTATTYLTRLVKQGKLTRKKILNDVVYRER